jgi:hypothetical protein
MLKARGSDELLSAMWRRGLINGLGCTNLLRDECELCSALEDAVRPRCSWQQVLVLVTRDAPLCQNASRLYAYAARSGKRLRC